MKEDKHIRKVINGTEVEGIILQCSDSEIEVKITKPFSDVSKGLHIPCSARENKTYLSANGYYTADRLLTELYVICQYINDNKKMLNERLGLVKQNEANLENFFYECFPVIIPNGTREEVLAYIESQ